jgi:hypothetical protein
LPDQGDDVDSLTGQLLAETREEINRADSKANIVLAVAGVGYGAIVAGLIAGQIRLVVGSTPIFVLTVLAAVLGGMGLLAAGVAVYPVVGTPMRGRASYFAEIALNNSVDELAEAIGDLAKSPNQRVLGQLLAVSRIAVRKYRWTQAAMWLFGASLALASLGGLLSMDI